MKRSVRLYIYDMCENMELALKFVKELDYEGFLENMEIRYAVIRCLEIVGEAARNIPETVRNEFPAIPWRDIVGMRNKIAHGYFDINLQTVWGVLKEDIPVLLPLLHKVKMTLAEIKQ
ncbi:MAG: DUF86 domain-containing protein [Chitinispirillaceae bacterium]|nr:DUF86 domain-containing protein [Chitinispirillaceae bacterium]